MKAFITISIISLFPLLEFSSHEKTSVFPLVEFEPHSLTIKPNGWELINNLKEVCNTRNCKDSFAIILRAFTNEDEFIRNAYLGVDRCRYLRRIIIDSVKVDSAEIEMIDTMAKPKLGSTLFSSDPRSGVVLTLKKIDR